MRVELNRFAGGRQKCLTMSYDDGPPEDRRLVEIFNRHGIRGSFHLNSGTLGQGERVKPQEVATLFAGHEVSAHSATHPFLDDLPTAKIVQEMLDDRKALEDLAGYPVRGMSYPFGTFNERVLGALSQVGIEYSRTVASTGNFSLPQNFLTWNPTCHHKSNLMELTERFLARQNYSRLALFYVWGHSYEFPRDNNWDLIETFCQRVGGRDDIWYATNIAIVDYCNAMAALRFSAQGHIAYNPSAVSVWISVDQKPVEVAAGATVKL